MKGKRPVLEQIIVKPHEADALLPTGATIGQDCQRLPIAQQTFHRRRNRYGGLKSNEAKRLKKPVAEQALDDALPCELAEGKW
jgi:putative transposase